jgi:CheY-like chemotaxis protein
MRDRSRAWEPEAVDVIAVNLENTLPPGRDQGSLAESPEAPYATPRTYGVLVVDDEGGLRGVLDVGMRQEGFAVWLAANGREALDLYRRHRETIDVVLLDVLMPGLDGPQTLAALQALNPQIRSCFMSGDLGSYTEERLRGLGAAAILQKPFRLAEVAQVLRQLASHGRCEPVRLVNA